MISDMERSRDGYRGRYRDRHENGSTNRNNHEDRLTRGNYRGRPSHANDHNGHHSFRSSPNGGSYHYRSSRTSYNSRPNSSRNTSSTHYRHHDSDDYPSSSHLPSSANRSSSGNSSQSSYYDNPSSSSRFDRSSNHREIYPSLLDEQPILSNGPLLSSSSYYASSSPPPSISFPRDRSLPLPPTSYIDSDRNRYMPLPNRRESPPPPPPPVPSYRNDRLMDYGSRNANNDIYLRGEYRPTSPPSLASLSVRGDPYADTYRGNDYGARSERYDTPSNRSSRDYPNYRNDVVYRSSSNVSMPSPSSYIPREQYPADVAYRPITQPRDYEIPLSRSNYSSLMDDRESSSRNSRDRNHTDYYSSYHDRPNLKRSASRYNDNGPIPSKRPMRR